MIVDLLKAIRDHPDYNKTQLIAIANWCFKTGLKKMAELNDEGFCRQAANGTWALTEKGADWLRQNECLLEVP